MTTRRETLVLMGGAMAGTIGGALAGPAPAGDPFEDHDALGLADLVRRREISPAELLAFAQARAARVEPAIHSIVVDDDAAARLQLAAGVPDGPFAGVPFLLKDLEIALAGTVTTSGSRYFADQRATEDDEIVRRYKRAGLVIFGKTGSPELGLTGTTESLLHGATRNPWDPERTAGGSSGGAAAAVAARIVPVAHASDGAGSIRTPASCCGVFGLKPTRGRVPFGPRRSEGWNGCGTQHAVSLSVRDSAALLDATAGPEAGSPYVAPPPARPFLAEVGAPPGRLRVALVTRPLSGVPVHPDCLKAVEDAGRLLEDLGHVVEPATLPVDFEATNAGMLATLCVATLAALQERQRTVGRAWTERDVESVTWRLAEMGRDVDGLAYAAGRAAFDRAGRDMARFHERYDVVLQPTLAQPPVRTGVLSLSPVDFDAYVRDVTAFGPFTALYNMTGQPAMSVPLHWSADGLPIGVMLAAPHGGEALLFRLAAQLEQARPWRSRRPPIVA
jgi:amidase/6-aminohexanoate-cyclic-dimer hydrolase